MKNRRLKEQVRPTRLSNHRCHRVSSMVSMTYNNLTPDFRKIWIKCPPAFDQGFGRTYGAEGVSRLVSPPTVYRMSSAVQILSHLSVDSGHRRGITSGLLRASGTSGTKQGSRLDSVYEVGATWRDSFKVSRC